MKTIISHFVVVFILISNTTSANISQLSNGLVFRISSNNISVITDNRFQQYIPFTEFNNKAEAGNFSDYLLAQKAINDFNSKGIKDAEIVAYFNQSRISMEDAFTLMNNRNKQESEYETSLSIEETDSIIASIRKDDFYFSVEFTLPDGKSVDAFYEMIKDAQVTFNSNGSKKYIYGKFYSSQDAIQIQNMFIREGISEIVLTAYDADHDRLPVERAIEIEKQVLQERLKELANR